jgi:hypothetical protein
MHSRLFPADEVREMSKIKRLSATIRPLYHIVWEYKHKSRKKDTEIAAAVLVALN